MNTRQRLTDPMPLLFYPDGERFIYIAPGPAVLVFAIEGFFNEFFARSQCPIIIVRGLFIS